jgi:hypothetical protein
MATARPQEERRREEEDARSLAEAERCAHVPERNSPCRRAPTSRTPARGTCVPVRLCALTCSLPSFVAMKLERDRSERKSLADMAKRFETDDVARVAQVGARGR